MIDPIKSKQETNPIEKDAIIIEKHEDGSECRKCSNCACVNNKLANLGHEVEKNDEVNSVVNKNNVLIKN